MTRLILITIAFIQIAMALYLDGLPRSVAGLCAFLIVIALSLLPSSQGSSTLESTEAS